VDGNCRSLAVATRQRIHQASRDGRRDTEARRITTHNEKLALHTVCVTDDRPVANKQNEKSGQLHAVDRFIG
jgi:hypothetical protein